MNNLLLSVIILSIVVLTGYLCSPIEHYTINNHKGFENKYRPNITKEMIEESIDRDREENKTGNDCSHL